MPEWLEELDHTADEGIRVSAPTEAVLFERCAWAMFRLLADVECVRPLVWHDIRVEAPDREALLVKWLAELNYRRQVEGMLFSSFEVREITETSVVARAGGEPENPARHHAHGEIKAVTYHGLAVSQEGGLWRATVLFDV
jgi:SHS2 domain-containing protein